VSPPRHQGPRLSLADIDPDASKALKTSFKPSDRPAKKDGTSDDASRRALKPTTRANSLTGVKRGREGETEKDGKEGAKKRRVEVDGTSQVGRLVRGWTRPLRVRSDADIRSQRNRNDVKPRDGMLAPRKKLDITTAVATPVRHEFFLFLFIFIFIF
jgi:hypothetical protein